MTDWYEFGGFQFESVDSDWADEEKKLALDQVDALGHALYRTYNAILLAKYESWWAIVFKHRHDVHPNFSRILGNVRKIEREKASESKERYFGLTKKKWKRVVSTLLWIQRKDRVLFPPDGIVESEITDFREAKVFRAPVCHSSFYALTPHGVYRVIETDEGRTTELYPLTDERVDYVESLIPGRSSDHMPMTEWSMVADFVS